MDWFPLLNSIRIALISTVIIFFVGIFSAYYIAKALRLVNLAISFVVLLAVNMLEKKNGKKGGI